MSEKEKCLSDLELVMQSMKEIEKLLREKIGARGHSATQNIKNVAHLFSKETVRKICVLGRIRNNFAHEEHVNSFKDLPSRDGMTRQRFKDMFKSCRDDILDVATRKKSKNIFTDAYNFENKNIEKALFLSTKETFPSALYANELEDNDLETALLLSTKERIPSVNYSDEEADLEKAIFLSLKDSEKSVIGLSIKNLTECDRDSTRLLHVKGGLQIPTNTCISNSGALGIYLCEGTKENLDVGYFTELKTLTEVMGFKVLEAAPALVTAKGNISKALEILEERSKSETIQQNGNKAKSDEGTECSLFQKFQKSEPFSLKRKRGKENEEQAKTCRIENENSQNWLCSLCTLENNSLDSFCVACCAVKGPSENEWCCALCTFINHPNSVSCAVCAGGKPMQKSSVGGQNKYSVTEL